MNNKYIAICMLFLVLILNSTSISSQEKKNNKPFEKMIFLELLIDTYKGDKNENYILYEPSAVTTDTTGNIYIINSRMNQISKFDNSGKFLKKWGSAGPAPGEFQFTGIGDSLTVGPDDRLYVVDRGQARVQIFSLEGKYLEGFNVQWGDWPDSIDVAKNGDIYLSVPPVNSLKRRFTIHQYKKAESGYKFVKGFSDSPIWLNDNNISQKENLHVTFAAMSRLAIDSDDNIYQVFENLPILRKFSPKREMIWQKVIDIRVLSNMKGKDIIYYENEMEPQKADRNNLMLYAKKRFTCQAKISNKNAKIYIFLTQKFAVLELTFDGVLSGAYYPCDVLLATREDIMKSGPMGKLWAFTNFAFNEETSKAFFVGLLTGELWVSNL